MISGIRTIVSALVYILSGPTFTFRPILEAYELTPYAVGRCLQDMSGELAVFY